MEQPYPPTAPPPYSPQAYSSPVVYTNQPLPTNANVPPPYSPPQVVYYAPPNAYPPPPMIVQYTTVIPTQPMEGYTLPPYVQPTVVFQTNEPQRNLYPQFELREPVPTQDVEFFVDQNKINANPSLPKDILYMGTTGRITAYDLSQTYEPSKPIDKTLPVKWTQKAMSENSFAARFHNTAFALHHNLPILISAFNGNISAISADRGDIIWQTKPSKANSLISDDLATIAVSPFNPGKIFYGCSGYGICLDQTSGKVLWETNIKKTGWNNVALLPFSCDLVIMGSMGICYGIDAHNGKILWESKLEGTGYGDLTLAKYAISNHGTYSEEILIVGLNGYIVNLNPKTGETKLKTNLRGTGYHAVSLLVDQEAHALFVVTNGKAYGYNPENHQEIWKNEMKGMGNLPGQGIVRLGDNLFVGTFGKVMAINKKTGTTLWTESLPSCGYDLVTVFVFKNRLLAGSNGKLYELNPGTGSVIWRDNLKGYSYSHLYLGSYATFDYTNHNSTTIVQFIAEGRRSNQ